jgi:hypothetical protein
MYPAQPHPAQLHLTQPHLTRHSPARSYTNDPYEAPEYPKDIRPLITRHRLRRQRRRKAATLLTGASIALGVAALRTPSASAHSTTASAPVTHASERPAYEPTDTQHPAPD